MQLSNRRIGSLFCSQPLKRPISQCLSGCARRKRLLASNYETLASRTAKMHGRSARERSHRVGRAPARSKKSPHARSRKEKSQKRRRRDTRNRAGPRRRARARARRGVRRPGAGRAVDGPEGVAERPQGAPAVAARPAERLLRPAEPRDDDLRLGAAGRGGAASASYLAVPRCCGAFTPSTRVVF